MARGGKGGVIDLCGQTTIKQLAAISEASDLFLGVDSAPMHIAAAVGTSVIALFGPTGEAQWGPWGDRHVVLNKIESCTDCKFDVCENAGVRKCLEIITVEEVITAITKILNG
ncbi:MAG: glycosyltransferase family 9 protein [Nitrospirota bacterium]